MSVSPDLVVMEELVKICQEATDVNADQDFWENNAKSVRFVCFCQPYNLFWLVVSVMISFVGLTLINMRMIFREYVHRNSHTCIEKENLNGMLSSRNV